MIEVVSNVIIPTGNQPKLPDPNDVTYNFNSPNVHYLFNRAWNFTIGPPGKSGFSYTSLRTVFDITKTSESTSNKAKIEIYNLNSESRSRYVKGLQVSLEAGYAGQIATLFVGGTGGACTRITNRRKGPDIITTFELGDAELSIYNSTFDRSYPPGTPYSLIVTDLLKALNLPFQITSLPVDVYNNGIALTGSVKRNLDLIMAKGNLQWSVQNGTVQVYPIGKPNTPTAIAVNMNTGLIGIPTEGNAGDNIVTFSNLLNPKLQPGSLVSLDSSNVKGIYIVRIAHYEGDSHGNKWQVTCECSPQQGVKLA